MSRVNLFVNQVGVFCFKLLKDFRIINLIVNHMIEDIPNRSSWKQKLLTFFQLEDKLTNSFLSMFVEPKRVLRLVLNRSKSMLSVMFWISLKPMSWIINFLMMFHRIISDASSWKRNECLSNNESLKHGDYNSI